MMLSDGVHCAEIVFLFNLFKMLIIHHSTLIRPYDTTKVDDTHSATLWVSEPIKTYPPKNSVIM